LYLNARFTNYFVQILIIRSKRQGEQRWSRGGGEKSSRGDAAPPAPILSAPMVFLTSNYILLRQVVDLSCGNKTKMMMMVTVDSALTQLLDY